VLVGLSASWLVCEIACPRVVLSASWPVRELTCLRLDLCASWLSASWFVRELSCYRDEWRSSSNCGQIAAKIAHFNSVNSEIIGRKFTKFGYDVAWLLPLNLLKADLWWANLLSNAEVKSKFIPWDVCEHLPYLTGCHSNVPWRPPNEYFENHPH